MKIMTGKAGTPHVTAQQFRQFVEGTVGQESYILTSGDLLEPELVSNNSLKIRSGIMSHHGNLSTVDLGTYDTVTIRNGSQGMKRIDLVVNRYTKNNETGIEKNEWIVIMGNPTSGSPSVPTYTQGNLQEGDLVDDCPVFEVHLSGINVTDVKKMLKVVPSIPTINKDLLQTLMKQGLKKEQRRSYPIVLTSIQILRMVYETRADASSRMSADQISDVALSLEYVKQYGEAHKELNYKQACLLEQCVARRSYNLYSDVQRGEML